MAERLLFIDHIFHMHTRSSDFVVEILRTRYDVELFYVDPDEADLGNLVERIEASNIVFVWQMDYLALVSCALGKPTAVAPMFDGSSAYHDEHFLALTQCGFVNFSFALHHRIRTVGGKSLLLKYYKEPKIITIPSFQELRVFLWQRRPDQGIGFWTAANLFGDQLRHLHLHNVPDIPSESDTALRPSPSMFSSLSISDWFPSRQDFERTMRSCNVLLAPRAAEGIGMLMLEAIASGMLVVAHDGPVHNEYIANWINGVLFNKANVGHADFSSAGEMAAMSYKSGRDGYRRWQLQKDNLLSFIGDIPAPPKLSADRRDALIEGLLAAVASGADGYQDFLETERLVSALSNGRCLSERSSITPDGFGVELQFGKGRARPYLRRGWSFDEADHIWMVEEEAFLQLPRKTENLFLTGLSITARHVNDALEYHDLKVAINDIEIAYIRVSTQKCRHHIDLSESPVRIRGDDRMKFTCSDFVSNPRDSRALHIAVSDVSLKFERQHPERKGKRSDADALFT